MKSFEDPVNDVSLHSASQSVPCGDSRAFRPLSLVLLAPLADCIHSSYRRNAATYVSAKLEIPVDYGIVRRHELSWSRAFLTVNLRWRIARLKKMSRIMTGSKTLKVPGRLLLAVVSMSSGMCCAADQPPASPATASSALYVKVQLDHSVKLSKLRPGDTLEGKLARKVYSADGELFPEESSVRLTVDHTEKRRRTADDHWPWIVKAFTPRHEQYPVFKTAVVTGAAGQSALRVTVMSISRRREVHAQAKRKPSGQNAGKIATVEVSKAGGANGLKSLAAPMVVLEAFVDEGTTSNRVEGATRPAPDLLAVETLPAGTALKVLLLGDVTASKNKPGDLLQARLLEPVFLNSRVALPAGTLFEGRVVKQTPPRWGSRAGSLSLTFTGLTLPGGNIVPLAASLVGAELERGSHTRIDAEGQLHGERPGKAWMAINIGVTAGLAKEVDDGTQLIVEALISTATDVSTAGTARIVSSCISGIFMVSRRGRDVVLPRFTEMDIALDRPLSVTRKAEPPPAPMMPGN
jgi:hypothetical protein